MSEVSEIEEAVEESTPAHTMPADHEQVLRDVLAHRGWDVRQGQLDMNNQFGEIIEAAKPLSSDDVSVSAPVGTGKSLAELLPGIVHGKRIVLATSTKRLQDQIMREELPNLAKDLKKLYNYDLSFSILKGRGNYACLCKIDGILAGREDAKGKVKGKKKSREQIFDVPDEDEEFAPTDQDIEILKEIIEHAAKAKSSREPYMYDTESLLNRLSPITRNRVRSSTCPARNQDWVDEDGREVDPEYHDEFDATGIPDHMASHGACIYVPAYAHAMTTQVIVMNTTLLVYEMIRANNPIMWAKPSVLRGRDTIVVDEAHHLARILAEAFSLEVNFGDIFDEAKVIAKRLSRKYEDKGTKLTKSEFVSIIRDVEWIQEQIDDLVEDPLTEAKFRAELSKILSQFFGRGKGFVERNLEMAARVERNNPSGDKLNRNGVPKAIASSLYTFAESLSTVFELSQHVAEKVEGMKPDGTPTGVVDYTYFISDIPEDGDIILKTVPIDVSFWRYQLERCMRMDNPYRPNPDAPIVFALTSGTITEYAPLKVGMKNHNHLLVESPFDPSRVRVWAPRDLNAKELGSELWAIRAAERFLEGFEAFGNGNGMVLNTSLKMTAAFAEAIRKVQPDVQVLAQTDGISQTEILSRFADADGENSVIVGSKSFWEGIDLPGRKLSLVAVDRAMIPPPDDPVFKALSEWVERQGRNSFVEVSCDYAATMLAQAFGRGQRKETDTVGLMLLESRIVDMQWGKAVLKLLPPQWMMTRDLEPFAEFAEWAMADKRDEIEMPPTSGGNWRPIRPVSTGHRRRKLG